MRFGISIGSALALWGIAGLGIATAAGLADNPRLHDYATSANAHKIGTELLRLEARMRARGMSLAAAMRDSPMQGAAHGLMLDLATTDLHADDARRFRMPGVTLRHFSAKYDRATVVVDDPAAMHALAALPAVRMVRPVYGHRTLTGSVDGRADEALRAARVTADLGVDGTGQTVGILSDSFARTAGVRDGDTSPPEGQPGALTGSQPQDSGDLPASVDLLRDDAGGALLGGAVTDEGAAMAELVSDVAPGADIAFHTAVAGGQAAFADAIDTLCAPDNASVIADDILFQAEPMYQDGIIAQAARDCVDSGVPFFSAVGNGANRGLRQSYRDIDESVDSGAFPPTGEDLHDFGDGDGFLDVTLPAGESVTVVLQWNQPFESLPESPGSQIDLDLYITDSPTIAALTEAVNGTSGSASVNQQGATGQPTGDAVEIASVRNGSGSEQTAYIAVDHFQGRQTVIPQDAGTPVELRLVLFVTDPLETTVQGIDDDTSAFGGPVPYGHVLADGVTSVGAVPFFETAAFNPALGPTPRTDPEPFSARGGELTIQFDATGAFAPRTRFEPDISAVDGNATTFFPPGGGQQPALPIAGGAGDNPRFFGTSAAAPNAAAVAALVRARDPGLSPAQINAALANQAVDITGARASDGVDDVTGPGLIDALATFTRPTAAAGADQRVEGGDTVTLNGTASADVSGSINAFAWTQTAGPSVSIANGNSAQANFIAPSAATATLTFQLRVTDEQGDTATDTVDVVVDGPPGDPPTADAGEDRTVAAGTEVSLDASASAAPEGELAGFVWNQIAGDPLTLAGPSTPSPTFIANVPEQSARFELTVTDTAGISDTDVVEIAIEPSSGSASGGSGGGGCSMDPRKRFAPMLPGMLLLAGMAVAGRRGRRR